jgi:mannose-6-phosphate isomerase-like protein (cupin superfamily)
MTNFIKGGQMKTCKGKYRVTALLLAGGFCMAAIGMALTARSYAGGANDEVKAAAGQAHQEGAVKKGFVGNIEDISVKNDDFRHVLYTAKHSQLVVMALKPAEEIGAETHKNSDQFFRIEEGSGEAVVNGVKSAIGPGFALVVPAGALHNVINTGSAPLKLYTIYSPPIHRDGVIHHTRAEAESDKEHFDGKTTE